MANFDLKGYIQEYTNGQVNVAFADKPKNDFDEVVFYEYKREGNDLTIIVDEKTFEPSDKKVAEALVNNVSFNIKEREKAESVLSDFVNREGRYIKIREKEEQEKEKERLRIEKEQEKERLKREKEEEKERLKAQKIREKEQKEELRNILKDLSGDKLEQLWSYANQLTTPLEPIESMEMADSSEVKEVDEEKELVTIEG